AFVRQVLGWMAEDVGRLAEAVREARSSDPLAWDPAALLEALASAVSWFSTNWLHPFTAVRMAVARLLGETDVDKHFETLLCGGGAPGFLQAHAALLRVKAGLATDAEYRREWAALYAAGDEEGPLASPGSADRLAARVGDTPGSEAPASGGPRPREAEYQA